MADDANIVIADDHGVLRAGLRLLLQREAGFHVVGEAEDVPALLRVVERARPDVVVLDLNMPGPDGLTAIPGLRERVPGAKVVVLTMQQDLTYAREALRAGADGYVLKESADSELVAAIRTVMAGGTYLHPALGAQLARTPETPALPDGLTDREADVLGLIALGHTNAEIAEQLHLGTRTVETHRAHLQAKLRRVTRAELVRYAIDHGLVELGRGRS